MEELFEDLFQGNVRVVDRGKEVESSNKSSDLDFVDFIDEDVPYEEWDSKQIDNSVVVCEDELEEEDMDWGVLDKDDCVNERGTHKHVTLLYRSNTTYLSCFKFISVWFACVCVFVCMCMCVCVCVCVCV